MEEARGRVVNEPTDPDVPLRVPAQRRDVARGQWPVVAAVSAGGGAGAAARYGASLLWPTASGTFPATTFAINAIGCAVIGVFMVVITDAWAAHRLVRPFFGTGVLGGFTTFSTYAVDIRRLVDGGHAGLGLAYLAATPLAAVASVWAAATLTRRVLARRPP
ncbi:CrcB family protein [Streptomyces sp. HPF1205]|uniref:FluC/FEX family fluoride channel n=1 Tax=Streptomyces sp. HPF1205 TaxID=2873262 RepID=UPI001CED9005|nr:CrcB family protein [Streptomyces sp. HPF1205]